MMKKIIHLFFPVIMLSLFSCHDTEAKHEMEEPDFDGFVKISVAVANYRSTTDDGYRFVGR